MNTTDAGAPAAERPPLVSVLVPIYNVERYLDECLASLAAQTFTHFEAICINDGSTDGSRDIIQRYMDADPRFRVIDKPNSGYGASMNRGLAEARGDFIAILESDDFMEPAALEKLHTAITKHDADVAKANFFFYWSIPTPRDEFFEIFRPDQCDRPVKPADDLGLFHAKPSIWSAMYRRSFLTENGIDFLETPGASFQDLSFTFKVWASARRVTYVYDALVHYRQDNENSSVNSMGKVNAVFVEYDEIDRWLAEHPDQRELFASTKTAMMYDSCIWHYKRVAPQHKVELLTLARTALLADQAAGTLDIRMLEPWKVLGMRHIMLSPAGWHREEMARGRTPRSLAAGAVRNFREGGVRKVVEVGRRKLREGLS